MSKLALGTAQFGLNYGATNMLGRIKTSEARFLLQRAQASGMDTLDTAINYGDSENVLGEHGVSNWKIVTKLPAIPEDCPNISQWIREQTQESLSRLGVKRLYGLLLHHPGQLLKEGGGEIYAAMQDLKKEGLVTKLGLSIYNPKELNLLFDRYNIDLIQAPINIMDQRLIESGWADRLKKSGVEIHARSIFLQGLLLIHKDQLPYKFNPWLEVWEEWHYWLKKNKTNSIASLFTFCN